MSVDSGMSDSNDGGSRLDISLEDIAESYHIPVLICVVVFMAAIRLRHYSRFIFEDVVYFQGNDAYYHYRQTKYTVENYPWTSTYDPFTQFPFGTHAGQFGTLFDQISATIALIIGLGTPSDFTIRLVLLVIPVVFGVLVVIPLYLLTKRLFGRFEGVIAIILLALIPGEFLRRSAVGFADHHSAEVFFQVFAVLAIVIALQVVKEEPPIIELFIEREWESLKRPLFWSGVSGVLVGLYVWVWPPGIVLIGIFGIFLFLWMVNEVRMGASPEPVGIFAIASMLTATLMIAFQIDTLGTSTSSVSLVHILMPFGVVILAASLIGLARLWEQRGYSGGEYVVTVTFLTAISFVIVRTFASSIYSTVMGNVDRVLVPSIEVGGTETIGEAQPMTVRAVNLDVTVFELFIMEYGLLIFIAIVGVVYMTLLDERRRADYWFVAVWAIMLGVMSIAQFRFNYYLAVPVAMFSGYVFSQLFTLIDLDSIPSRSEVSSTQIFGVAIILILVVPVLFVPIPLASSAGEDVTANNAVQTVNTETAPSEVVFWEQSLDWMNQATPEPGTLRGENNQMDPYASYDRPTDDNFDYPDGAYGVMAWWDYGHWITAEGERIPYSNPFQQGTTESANYLLAPTEDQANNVVDTLDDDSELRYVMVDWETIHPTGHIGAPLEFYDDEELDIQDLLNPVQVDDPQFGTYESVVKEQRYYESMAFRLYHYHGSAVPAQPIVVQFDDSSDNSNMVLDQEEPIIIFETMEEAEEYVSENPNTQIGGVGQYPREDIEALEQYRLVYQNPSSALTNEAFQQSLIGNSQAYGINPEGYYQNFPSWLKTFERVNGATVEGEGPTDTTVQTAVEMYDPVTEEVFIYRQYADTDENGEFEMTVPYSTQGYDNWGTSSGYTNMHIQSTGPYYFFTDDQEHMGTADVTEGQVLGEEDEPVTVTLEEELPDEDEEELPDEDEEELPDEDEEELPEDGVVE